MRPRGRRDGDGRRPQAAREDGASRQAAGRRGADRTGRADRADRAGRVDRADRAGRGGNPDRRSGRGGQAPQTQPSGDRRDRRTAAAAVRRPAAGGPPAAALAFKAARRKDEWLELRLPDGWAAVPLAAVLKQLPVPPKLASKLNAEHGIVRQGKQLRLKLFPRERPGFPPDWMELNVLYEDDFTLVVNKPVGVEVHPSQQGQRWTLAHAVAAYYEAAGQECRVRHIHRLDKDTSGAVLYAKNELAHYEFDKAMREKEIERIYLAVAEGVIAQDRGTIDKPIGQDRHHSTRRRVSDTGEHAVTRFEVVERFAKHTLVRLRLETGRTHQIRVHLQSIGHPLAGDGLYGGTREYIKRQALHGDKLIWRHPWTGERMEAQAPMPDDLAGMLQSLRLEKN